MRNETFTELTKVTTKRVKDILEVKKYEEINLTILMLDLISFFNQMDEMIRNNLFPEEEVLLNRINEIMVKVIKISYAIIKRDNLQKENEELTIENIFKWFKEKSDLLLNSIKNKEYATTDRLHNFYKTGALFNKSPLHACLDFTQKHLTSLHDIFSKEVKANRSTLEEKVIDIYNYLILLKGLLIDMYNLKKLNNKKTLFPA